MGYFKRLLIDLEDQENWENRSYPDDDNQQQKNAGEPDNDRQQKLCE